MINIMKQSNKVQAYVNEYVADTEDDIKDLPITDAPGSVCIVIATSNVYMLDNQKTWNQL